MLPESVFLRDNGLPGCGLEKRNSKISYALAIAALQAFAAPTTVKQINGLIAYMIWFRHCRQPQNRQDHSYEEI